MAKIDTVSGALEATQDAMTAPHEPPQGAELAAADRPFWEALMATRARRLWTPADLHLAAQLARYLRRTQELEAQVEQEGAIYRDQHDTPKAHPAVKMSQDLSRQCVAIARLLQVHPLATAGRSENQTARNEANRNASRDHDDLIARPVKESTFDGDDLIARPLEH